MKRFKEYINKNKEQFDDLEPSMGHELRFEQLLQNAEEAKKEKHSKKMILFSVVSVAASLLVLFLATRSFSPQSDNEAHLANNEEPSLVMPEDIEATNEYYIQKLEEHIADIECKMAYIKVESRGQMAQDLEAMKRENEAFIQEMTRNEDKELAMYYLVQHYESNIKALEYIDSQLGNHIKCQQS